MEYEYYEECSACMVCQGHDVPEIVEKPKEVKEEVTVCVRCGNFFPVSQVDKDGYCGCQ